MAPPFLPLKHGQEHGSSHPVIEQSQDIQLPPHLCIRYAGNTTIGCLPPFSEDDSEDYASGKALDTVMAEVADFLELDACDDFWRSYKQKPHKTLPCPKLVTAQLAGARHAAIMAATQPKPCDIIIQFIALELLASCYTLLPATSAHNLPLFPQRRGSRLITALRLHAHHWFSPAAGFHARESSASAPWPGLFEGPSVEERLVESRYQQQRLEKRYKAERKRSQKLSDSGRGRDATQWQDGPAPEIDSEDGNAFQRRTTSSSSLDVGMFSRFLCQPSKPKQSGRKSHFLFFPLRRGKDKQPPEQRDKQKASSARPRPCPVQRLTSHSVLKTPSTLRLRRTQSAPRTPSDSPKGVPATYDTRRNSSTLAIGSAISYPFEIPEIRRISASTMTANSQASVHACGRGDLLRAQEYTPRSRLNSVDETNMSAFDAFPSASEPFPVSDGISPLDSTATHMHGGKASRSDYFEAPPPVPQEESEGSSKSSIQSYHSPDSESSASSEGDSASDDSVITEKKRRGMAGLVADDAVEFALRLQRQGSGEFYEESKAASIK